FHTFCQGVRDDRFPRLDDRDNLWALLVTITARKARRLRLYHLRDKRGGGKIRDEAALAGTTEMSLEEFIADDPSPEVVAQAAEESERLLAGLPGKDWRALVQAKMEGYTNEEIAARLGCSLRGVERRLRLIREFWSRDKGTPDSPP